MTSNGMQRNIVLCQDIMIDVQEPSVPLKVTEKLVEMISAQAMLSDTPGRAARIAVTDAAHVTRAIVAIPIRVPPSGTPLRHEAIAEPREHD